MLRGRFFFAIANRLNDKKAATASRLTGCVCAGSVYFFRLTHAPRKVSYSLPLLHSFIYICVVFAAYFKWLHAMYVI